MNFYKCNGECKQRYNSALYYSELEKKVQDNNICCGLPIWYTQPMVGYLKKNNLDQLNKDYAKYLQDLLAATTKTSEGQYLLRF